MPCTTVFFLCRIPLRSRPHRDPSSPMDVRMFSPLLLDVQITLNMSVLLEPVSPSGNGSTDVLQRFLPAS